MFNTFLIVILCYFYINYFDFLSCQTSSKSRLRNLDSLHGFVSAATKELMWLNDKEEEEVNFDWSDRNTNMTAKKDNYSVCVSQVEQDSVVTRFSLQSFPFLSALKICDMFR